MTFAPARASQRYAIEERFEGTPRGERALATDERLKRRVVLWTAGGEPTDPRREALLSLGRQAARLDHPVFLPVLDAIVEPGRATVALQAPSCPPLAADQTQRFEEIGGAKRVVLEVARAVDDASRHGLRARWLPLTYLYCCPEGTRLDPIGVLAMQGEEVGNAVGLLLGLAEEIGAHDAELMGIVERWRNGASALRSLQLLVEELEAIAPEAGTDPLLPSPANDVTMPLPALHQARPYSAPYPADPARKGPPVAAAIATAAVVVGTVLLGTALGSGFGLWGAAVQGADQTGGPTPVPANVAMMKLTAQRDTQVRVWVDQQLQADGVLKQGSTQSFRGSRQVHVWTNGGKDLQLEINGYALGTVSEAVGQPQWNTVDWAWPAGWKPPGR